MRDINSSRFNELKNCVIFTPCFRIRNDLPQKRVSGYLSPVLDILYCRMRRETSQEDRSARCPVRYPPRITNTDHHAVQSAIRHVSQTQIITLSSPLSATYHKDRTPRCPVRYPPRTTKTDPNAFQSAIRHMSQRQILTLSSPLSATY